MNSSSRRFERKLLAREYEHGPTAAAAGAHPRSAADARAGALLVHAPAVLQSHRQRVAELALRHRLPTMFHQRVYVDAGGLMSHGADSVDIWHRAATFVGKILEGAKPGDLPVEQATKFKLVIDLNVAKALGLNIAPSFLLRADEVLR